MFMYFIISYPYIKMVNYRCDVSDVCRMRSYAFIDYNMADNEAVFGT